MEIHTKVQVLLHHHLKSIIFFLLHIRYFNKSDHNFLRAALEKKLLNSDHLSLILPLAKRPRRTLMKVKKIRVCKREEKMLIERTTENC